MDHGTRSAYVCGCRCDACTRAEAAYKAHLRIRKVKGRTLLGAHISADETRHLLTQLLREEAERGDVARALGLKSPQVKIHTQVTVRKSLRIKRLHRQWFSEGLGA